MTSQYVSFLFTEIQEKKPFIQVTFVLYSELRCKKNAILFFVNHASRTIFNPLAIVAHQIFFHEF